MTTTQTQLFLNEYITLIDTEKEYTPSELRKLVTEVYNTINGKQTTKKSNTEPSKAKKQKREPKLDSDGNVVKRAPTEYNIFVKNNIGKVKEENPELSRPELMKIVAIMWKNQKEGVQEKEEVEEEVKEEVEEEVKEKVNEKKGRKGKKQ